MQTKDVLYYFNSGLSYAKEYQNEKAIESFNKAIEINPNYPQIYYNLANTYNEINQYDFAIENYKKAAELDPTMCLAFNNLGITYAKKEQYDLAIESFKKAIEINPDFITAYNSLGITYYKQKHYELSIDVYKKAIELNPDYFEAYKNLGVSYLEIDCTKAIEYSKKALLLNNNSKEVYNNLAIAYYKERAFDFAIENYHKALKLDPNFVEVYSNLSALHLIKGEFEKGWELYECRFSKEGSRKIKIPELSQPRWNGESLENKTIYVYKEQGFGDTIMFSRYIPLLKNIAQKVIFRPQPQLKDLFEINFSEVEILNDSISDENIQFDTHIPLLSLPLMLKTDLNNIPSTEGYLKADSDKINFYKEKIATSHPTGAPRNAGSGSFKIGIFWYGDHRFVPEKSTDLSYFYRLAELPNIKLYSLQKGYGNEQLKNKPENIDIVDLGSSFNDYSDTAAAIANLDLVITIDTSVAHIAGAMNKPAWVLLHTENEWRWMVDREDTPWYKSIKLFRQKEKDNWQEVFDRVCNELKSHIFI